MNLKLIMSYGLAEQSLYNRENNTSIKGSWLYDLAKKYVPTDTDKHISLVGLDSIKRIEVMVSIYLFNELKNDPVFIMKAENLRRLRTEKIDKSKHRQLIEYLCYPISHFDNDLDAKETEN